MGFFLILCVLSLPVLLFSAPKIKVKPEIWNFGNVEDKQYLEKIFKIENCGDSILYIYKINFACDCIITDTGGISIKPKEKYQLKVGLNPRGYSGKIEKFIFLQTNDPKKEIVRLRIFGNVKPGPSPKLKVADLVEFGVIDYSEATEKTIFVENIGEENLIIFDITPSMNCDAFMELPAQIKPNQKLPVVLVMRPIDYSGVIRENLVLQTNDFANRKKEIWVTGYVSKKSYLFSIERLVATKNGGHEFLIKNKGAKPFSFSLPKLPSITWGIEQSMLNPGDSSRIFSKADSMLSRALDSLEIIIKVPIR